MSLLQKYLLNPCATLPIPYWKNQTITIPPTMKILHHTDFHESLLDNYKDVPYFRFVHNLESITPISIPSTYEIQLVDPEHDLEKVASFINNCYTDISVTINEVTSWKTHAVYNQNLWIWIMDKELKQPVGLGIAEQDGTIKEGVLEWIQVFSSHRGLGIGQLIVNELLHRMKENSSFVTVSGQVENATNPCSLYKKCGFTGNDIWHILYEK